MERMKRFLMKGNKVKTEKLFLKRMGGRVLIVVSILLAGFLIRHKLDQTYEDAQVRTEEGQVTVYEDGSRVGRDLEYAENVPEDNKILQEFKELYPEAKVLAACEEDLTDDGWEDLVVVFNQPEDEEHKHSSMELVDGGHIRLAVMIDGGDGQSYVCSEPIPAPVENQRIKFQNIDQKDEIEFILQGQKGTEVGYGVYRVMNGEPVNLFGEGMEEC